MSPPPPCVPVHPGPVRPPNYNMQVRLIYKSGMRINVADGKEGNCENSARFR